MAPTSGQPDSVAAAASARTSASTVDGEVVLEDPGLSDRGFRTRPASPENNAAPRGKTLSPQTSLSDPCIASATPLIFKIDMEGSEDNLSSGDTSWMDAIALIIIEPLHRMLPFSGNSRNFLEAIARYEFDLAQGRENLLLLNRRAFADRAGHAPRSTSNRD